MILLSLIRFPCAGRSPKQRLQMLTEPWEVNFPNADLTIVLYRLPEGEWMGSEAIGHWASNGIGLADATLLDEKGIVGRAVQTLLIRKS